MQRHRQQAESYLHTHLGSVPPSVGAAGTAFRLQRAAGAAPEHGPLDLLSLALPVGQQLALQLNPFLSDESAERLQQGARTWLQVGGRLEDCGGAAWADGSIGSSEVPACPVMISIHASCLRRLPHSPPTCSCVCWKTGCSAWCGWRRQPRAMTMQWCILLRSGTLCDASAAAAARRIACLFEIAGVACCPRQGIA